MGVDFLPSRVTGFSAMSRRQMITFIEGRHFSANSSQRGFSAGLFWRFTLTMTCFASAINPRAIKTQAGTLSFVYQPCPRPELSLLLCGVIVPRPRWNLRNVHRLVRELDFAIHPL